MGDDLTIEALRSALAGRSDVVVALLFGSRARGTQPQPPGVSF